METKNIINIEGIDCFEQDGVAYLKLETCARGLGFTEQKGEKDYVMWRRVEAYLENLGFGTSAERPDFIPENVFYRLAMKAKNAVAEAFQAKIADEVIPAIRKYGLYANKELLLNPDMMIAAMEALKAEQEKNRTLKTTVSNQKTQIAKQQQQISELKPKASYYDLVLNCKDLLPISVIAKDYGWSAIKMNTYLKERGIQFKRGGTWLLYQKYADKGYTHTKTFACNRNGQAQFLKRKKDKKKYKTISVQTCWTQAGRLFIYELMKADGLLPLIEQENFAA